VLANVRSQYGANNAKIVSQWEEWAAEAPQSDDMQEHIEAHPEKYRIPFRDSLFGDLAVSSEAVVVLLRGLRGTPNRSSFNWRQPIVSSGRAMGERDILWNPESLLVQPLFMMIQLERGSSPPPSIRTSQLAEGVS
jgi:hypothetical protein